jgi:hypothetical protein
MATLEQLAQAALNRDNLMLRSLVQDWLRDNPRLSEVSRPRTGDSRVLAAAASLIELFAQRARQNPPAWVKEVGPLSEPVFLLESAASMKRLRVLCETQAPEPLRKRRLYAPPNFLEFA